jgi:hypothetical protein
VPLQAGQNHAAISTLGSIIGFQLQLESIKHSALEQVMFFQMPDLGLTRRGGPPILL